MLLKTKWTFGSPIIYTLFIAKFMGGSVGSLSDFSLSSPFQITSYVPNSADFSSESGQTISSSSTITIGTNSDTDSTPTYWANTPSTSDVLFQTNYQTYFFTGGYSQQFTPSLPWSYNGNTVITYSIVDCSGCTSVATFVSIDSSTGVLTITAPSVLVDTVYNFYINSATTSNTNLAQNLISFTIKGWLAESCQKWSSTDSSVWVTWTNNYELKSGKWSAVETQKSTTNSEAKATAEALSSASGAVVGATSGIVGFGSLMNTSSMASLWSLVNQMQIFFLLFLTRAYIPEEVGIAIKGPSFALNPSSYLPFKKIKMYDSVLEKFNFEQSTLFPFAVLSLKSNNIIFSQYQ